MQLSEAVRKHSINWCGFDWPLQLALRITGTEPAAQSIYSETMLRMPLR